MRTFEVRSYPEYDCEALYIDGVLTLGPECTAYTVRDVFQLMEPSDDGIKLRYVDDDGMPEGYAEIDGDEN